MDDDRLDAELRGHLARLAPPPHVEPELALFRTRRAARRRRRRALLSVASVVVIGLVAAGVAAAVGDHERNSTGVVTDPGDSAVASTTSVTTTSVPGTSMPSDAPMTMPQLAGQDYSVALDALASIGLSLDDNVRLSLDLDAPDAMHGQVIATAPPAGTTVDSSSEVVVTVAASATELGLPRSQPASNPPFTVATTEDFPPAGLLAGVVDGSTAPECPSTVNGTVGRAVRFIRGELVGCLYNRFVWLDQVPDALREVGSMPDVLGLSIAEAETMIAAAAPAVRVDRSADGRVDPSDRVRSASVSPGQPVTRADGVALDAGPLRSRDADEVQAFFSGEFVGACVSRLGATRTVPAGRDAIEFAFEQHFAGPTAEEQANGAWWWSDDAANLRSITLRDGLLVIDVEDIPTWIAGNYNTSCGSMSFFSGLLATAFQFADVDRVQLAAEGSCQAAAVFENDGCEIRTRADWLADPNRS